MTLLDELPKMLFEGVAAGTGQLDDLSDANAPMFASLIQDLHGKIRQACKHQLFPFHLFREPSHLLMQAAKKTMPICSPVLSNAATLLDVVLYLPRCLASFLL